MSSLSSLNWMEWNGIKWNETSKLRSKWNFLFEKITASIQSWIYFGFQCTQNTVELWFLFFWESENKFLCSFSIFIFIFGYFIFLVFSMFCTSFSSMSRHMVQLESHNLASHMCVISWTSTQTSVVFCSDNAWYCRRSKGIILSIGFHIPLKLLQ